MSPSSHSPAPEARPPLKRANRFEPDQNPGLQQLKLLGGVLKKWVSTKEPSASALKEHRQKTFQQHEVDPHDPEAAAKMHLPLGTMPPGVTTSTSGPTPEKRLAKEQQGRRAAATSSQRGSTPSLSSSGGSFTSGLLTNGWSTNGWSTNGLASASKTSKTCQKAAAWGAPPILTHQQQQQGQRAVAKNSERESLPSVSLTGDSSNALRILGTNMHLKKRYELFEYMYSMQAQARRDLEDWFRDPKSAPGLLGDGSFGSLCEKEQQELQEMTRLAIETYFFKLLLPELVSSGDLPEVPGVDEILRWGGNDVEELRERIKFAVLRGDHFKDDQATVGRFKILFTLAQSVCSSSDGSNAPPIPTTIKELVTEMHRCRAGISKQANEEKTAMGPTFDQEPSSNDSLAFWKSVEDDCRRVVEAYFFKDLFPQLASPEGLKKLPSVQWMCLGGWEDEPVSSQEVLDFMEKHGFPREDPKAIDARFEGFFASKGDVIVTNWLAECGEKKS